MAHVANWKKAKVGELANLLKESPVVGIIGISGIPGPQMQKMRKKMRGKGQIIVTKNTLLSLALKEASKSRSGLDDLMEKIDGQIALIATDINPFRLYKEMEATKTKTPAKGGEVAPEDIEIKGGDTPFKPGPIVGDLQKAGIPAAIESGKVIIKKDKLLVKAGDTIPTNVAQMLTRLEIYPLTVGMDLAAAFEDGTVYDKRVLHVDEEQFMGNLNAALSQAFNLAVYIGYPTLLTIRPLLTKVHTEALNLAVFAGIPNSETVKPLFGKSYGQMLGLASRLSEEALDDELKALVAGASAAPAPSGTDEKKDGDEEKDKGKDEEEKEVSEEDAAAGLGALFG